MNCKIIKICLLFILAAFTGKAQYIVKIAGNDSAGYYGDGGLAPHASFFMPKAICRDKAGNLYIGHGGGSTGAHCLRIRKIDAITGIVTTIAGTSGPIDSADVIAATNARFGGITGICLDNNGNIIIADNHCRIRKLDQTTGIITNVAGHSFNIGFSGDGGPATAALLHQPYDVAVDKHNNIYIADFGNRVVRKVDGVTGNISTVAGDGTWGNSGDGAAAISAKLKQPMNICVDSSNNLYIADMQDGKVRKVNTATGIITTIAGNGTLGGSGDGGPATAASFGHIDAIAIDMQQNLYIADGSNHLIRRVSATTGILTAIAGNGVYPGTLDSAGDDRPATSAKLNPGHMCFDTCGNLFLGSFAGCRIRAITQGLPTNGNLCGITYNGVYNLNNTSIQKLHLYPNPNDGQFTLRLSTNTNGPVHVLVTDISGRNILQLETTSNKDNPIHLYAPPGLYFVNVSSAEGTWAKKVVIE